MYEVVTMVKQLDIPTWFMTLSCADLRWPELFQIIAQTNGKNMSEEVEALSYDERCRLPILNPVIVAKHFQYRVETLFTKILLANANPTSTIVYYALCIEFQMRGSPHLQYCAKVMQTEFGESFISSSRSSSFIFNGSESCFSLS